MGKGGKTQTTTTAPDVASQQHINRMRSMAQAGANVALQGPNPMPPQSMYGGGFPGGQAIPPTGGVPGMGGGQPSNSFFTGAITPEQIQAAMNPYMDNVIGGVRGEFDHLRGQAQMGADQQATMAGAFGGSRHGVMSGARLGEIDRAQTSQISGLLNQGYGQALNFAEHQRGLQQQQQMEPLWRQQQAMGLMNLGMGPVGQTQTQPMQSNKWGSALGGAAVGSTFGLPGAIAGGLGGLIFG